MNPKGVADGKLVNIPAPALVSMGRRSIESSSHLRNSAIKYVAISFAGKSAEFGKVRKYTEASAKVSEPKSCREKPLRLG